MDFLWFSRGYHHVIPPPLAAHRGGIAVRLVRQVDSARSKARQEGIYKVAPHARLRVGLYIYIYKPQVNYTYKFG